MPNYRLLNNINYPSDLKKLNVEELKKLAVELRTELIDAVSETGGHLGGRTWGCGTHNSSPLCF